MTKPLLPPVFVNGVEIPSAAIALEAQNHPAPKGKPGHAWRAAAQALAMREVLLQEARSRGLAGNPFQISSDQVETQEEAMIRELLEIEISPGQPSEDELRASWQNDPDRFRAPDLWEVSHILLAERADAGAARLLAENLADRLSVDPGQFESLARKYSDCSSKGVGGRLGQLGPGDTVPEFEAALHRLGPGDITLQPVETRFGFHLIRLDAFARGERLPFESVRHGLEIAIQKARWAREARAFAASLIGRANVSGI